MSFTFRDNEQVATEIKKLLLDTKVSQREIAAALGVTPQGITKILNKKNFGFEDVQKFLGVLGYEMDITFRKK